MSVYYPLYAALVVLSGAVAGLVAGLAWRNRDVAGSVPLAVLSAAVTVWAATTVAELASPGLEATRFWANLKFLGIVTVPVAWFLFARQYSGHDDRLDRRFVAAVTAEPALILLLVWTNGAHGLFRHSATLLSVGPYTVLGSTSGPAFWLHTAYSYLLLVAGTWLIVRLILLTDHLYWWQATGLLFAVAIPWAGNGAYLLGVFPGGLDPTIIAFSASGVILLATITRYRLLDLIPVAREIARGELIERMTDGVIVVDDRGQIVDCNPAAAAILDGSVPGVIGEPLATRHPQLGAALEDATPAPGEAGRTEFSTWDGEAYRHYDVRVSPLRRGRGLLTGSLISIRDVTGQRQREQRLDVMNRLLRHDLRNKLNAVLGTAEVLEEELDAEAYRSRARTIQGAASQLVDRADRVTGAMTPADPMAAGPTDLAAEVGAIVDAKRREHPDARVTQASPAEAWTAAGPAVVTAIEELVSNALEHGDQPAPTVHVDVSTESAADGSGVRVRVVDDGPGIPDDEVDPIRRGRETQLAHSTGVGLWLATWVARDAGGDIGFDEVDGRTAVTLHLPRASTETVASAA